MVDTNPYVLDTQARVLGGYRKSSLLFRYEPLGLARIKNSQMFFTVCKPDLVERGQLRVVSWKQDADDTA